MQLTLHWRKKFFSNLYSIYSNDERIGTLQTKTFSQTSTGELYGRKFTFRTKGFFTQNTEIIDDSENKVIGGITYNSWMTKATISIDKQEVIWRYDNVWNSKWSVIDAVGTNILYEGSSSSGMIDTNTGESLLILSGLFVRIYYWQMSLAVLIAIFVPIWTTVLR